MIIFARTHFSKGNAKTFTLLLNLAIYARACLALFAGIATKFLAVVNPKPGKADVEQRRIAVIGDKAEAGRIKDMLHSKNDNFDFIGLISPLKTIIDIKTEYIGKLDQLKEVIEIYNLNEIIFCSKDLSPQLIMDQMKHIKRSDIRYKIAPPNSSYIIGSKSIISFAK